ncbi:flagellar assembly protein FliH [Methylovorus sp. MM2]|uniref:flagellar assembly protein FliH n=1 Tax=Methylovorus sp. MM2 TaxID=1848038 RepID=UPI0007E08CEF|nr:flagellar assembly protein FliH [Methylovorus sp. MM2]OAM51259.1 flagellar assembly protein FliH [Methylovorus sp. MM2]
MSSAPVPKEQQTAYQRWELSSFADGKAGVTPIKPKKEMPKNDPVEQERLANIVEGLRKEAFTKGMQEGFAVGMAQAREREQEERDELKNLAQGFSEALHKADEEVAEQLLELALDIAKAMLKAKMSVDPMVIIPVVKDAIHYLPYVQKPAKILVHPEDAKLLKEHMSVELTEQNWMVLEEAGIERGGCIVETAANQIDATNATRWKRISDALAQSGDWIEE